MRFFVLSCLVCLVFASLGCMTNNWSSPLFKKEVDLDSEMANPDPAPNFWNTPFGSSAGVDARAREIEKRLGY